MASRVLVMAALAASIAVAAVAVIELTTQATTRAPASHADVYKQLAQQLKGHLQPLVPATATIKRAPSINVPPQQGYSCAVATTDGCSLHPCVKYAVDRLAVPAGPGVTAITPASSGRCSNAAHATPRQIPISTP